MAREQVARAPAPGLRRLLAGRSGWLAGVARGRLPNWWSRWPGRRLQASCVVFTGFLELAAAGAELVLFEIAGAEVAGAGVFCAAIKLAAASIVKIIGFIFVSFYLSGVNLIHLPRTILP